MTEPASKSIINVFQNATKSWVSNQPVMHSAAASYFAVFSLPGILIILVSIATFFIDEEIVRGHIHNYIGNFMGQGVAESVESIIDNARLSSTGWITLIIGGGIILFGSTGLFNQLKVSMNSVWGITPRQEKLVLRLLVNRMVSLSVAILVGFLFLMSMFLSATLEVFGSWMVKRFPELYFMEASDFSISFFTITLFFTIIFKVLPDVKIKMKYALLSGALCSLLFMLGEFGFAYAIDIIAPQSVFGAAGSIILVMIWVTYGCMILQYGAQFIKALMHEYEDEDTIRTKRFAQPFDGFRDY